MLGDTETVYLNEIINDFESYLESNYEGDDIESKYKIYLGALSQNKLKVPWKIDSAKMLKYVNSNLFSKYDSIYPDSVWIEHEMINLKFYEKEIIESIIPINRRNRPLNIDSMINNLRNTPELREITQSSFFFALDSIITNDSIIINFLEVKRILGNISKCNLASGLLNENPNFSDYFIKRIILKQLILYCQVMIAQSLCENTAIQNPSIITIQMCLYLAFALHCCFLSHQGERK